MTADEQLLYEARVRPRQAVIAGVAAAALLGASMTQLVGPHSKVNELTIGLITEHKRIGLDLTGAASRRSVRWRWPRRSYSCSGPPRPVTPSSRAS